MSWAAVSPIGIPTRTIAEDRYGFWNRQLLSLPNGWSRNSRHQKLRFGSDVTLLVSGIQATGVTGRRTTDGHA